jgi:rhodanese-related sulfurtransferase
MNKYLSTKILIVFMGLFGFSVIEPTELSPIRFYEKIAQTETPIILDARLYEHYYQERIEGAIWIGEKDDLEFTLKGIEKDTPLYLYCYEGGKRGKTVASLLFEMGFKQVFFLKGGIEKWINKGLPTITTPPT